MNVQMNVIPHQQQRYDTPGDWLLDVNTDTLVINVSFLGDWKMEACLGVHEYIEAVRCMADRIDQTLVDAWDLNFKGKGEPGDDPNAPYHRQHVQASIVERTLARQLGVDWSKYEQKLEELKYEHEASNR
jgi:hypothetical protein